MTVQPRTTNSLVLAVRPNHSCASLNACLLQLWSNIEVGLRSLMSPNRRNKAFSSNRSGASQVRCHTDRILLDSGYETSCRVRTCRIYKDVSLRIPVTNSKGINVEGDPRRLAWLWSRFPWRVSGRSPHLSVDAADESRPLGLLNRRVKGETCQV